MNLQNRLNRPIIFIGTGRSGTTIISELIMRHPDLAFPSNYQDAKPAYSKINMIRLLLDNALWRTYGQKPQLNKDSILNKYTFRASEAYNMWDYLIGDKHNFSRDFMINIELNEDKINFIRKYFNRMVKYQGRKRLAIKITGPSRLSFLLKIFPDADIINLKRQLIPTISSFLKVHFWAERGENRLWWTGAYSEKEIEWANLNKTNPELLAAFQLKKIHDITSKEVKEIKPSYLEIEYENFVKDPKLELDRIISFTELPNFEYTSQLKKIRIFNRNKSNSDYFDEKKLASINKIIN